MPGHLGQNKKTILVSIGAFRDKYLKILTISTKTNKFMFLSCVWDVRYMANQRILQKQKKKLPT